MGFIPTTKAPPEILDFQPAESRQLRPVLISVPHSGEEIPDFLSQIAAGEWVSGNIDCDWFVHQIYDFAPLMGMELVRARASRFVVDLNRPLPDEEPLYPGSDRISGVLPTHTFDRKPIYLEDKRPDEVDFQRRIQIYYQPYYEFLRFRLEELARHFGTVLFWDAHSIAPVVKSIREEPFEHFNFSNRDGLTCPLEWLERLKLVALDHGYTATINHPFRGGNLTRSMGSIRPEILSLQLELSQATYLKENNRVDPGKLRKLQLTLKEILSEAAVLVESYL